MQCQLCVDISVHIISELDQTIPDTMGLAFAKLFSEGIISKDLSDNLRNAVGFRNIAVHNYQDLDWEVVFEIAHEKLSDFKEFTKQIVNHLES